jgi:hypothetical protein
MFLQILIEEEFRKKNAELMFSKLDIYPALCIVSFITPECPL